MSDKKKKAPAAAEKLPAVVMGEISLTSRQSGIIAQETPKAFIKSKPGRGGKRVSFVEGGYVISKLNEVFSPLGWEFEVVEHGQTERKNENSSEGEVWVRGKLTIVDHVNGYRVSKTQFGQHPIHKNVPIGDAFKAAGTDALKKCASLVGIALDVYWGTLDTNEAEEPKKPSREAVFEKAKMMIQASQNIDGLIKYDDNLKSSKLFNEAQKKELSKLARARVAQLEVGTGK